MIAALFAFAAARPGIISPLWGDLHAPIIAHDPWDLAAPLGLSAWAAPAIIPHSPIIAAAPLHAPLLIKK